MKVGDEAFLNDTKRLNQRMERGMESDDKEGDVRFMYFKIQKGNREVRVERRPARSKSMRIKHHIYRR